MVARVFFFFFLSFFYFGRQVDADKGEGRGLSFFFFFSLWSMGGKGDGEIFPFSSFPLLLRTLSGDPARGLQAADKSKSMS